MPPTGPPAGTCASCASANLEALYHLDRIPAHSVLLMPSADVARDYPTGTLDLAVCLDCGFLTNTSFDASLNDYSSTYEETQGFSGVFQDFAQGLAKRWVDTYDIRGKRVLEIGCGKGEFLALLCDVGGNEGIGIDPAAGARPARPGDTRTHRLPIPSCSRRAHADLEADVIVCRHTLEHIQPVAEFMRLIRTTVGRTTRDLGPVRAARRAPCARRGRLLGRLLRALLVLHHGFARTVVPARGLRPHSTCGRRSATSTSCSRPVRARAKAAPSTSRTISTRPSRRRAATATGPGPRSTIGARWCATSPTRASRW